MPSSVTSPIQCERPPLAAHLGSPVLVAKPNWKSHWQPFALPTITFSSSSPTSSSDEGGADSDENPPEKATGPHRHQSSSLTTHMLKRGGSATAVVAASIPSDQSSGKKKTKTRKVTVKGAAARAPILEDNKKNENKILFDQKTTSYNEFTNFANYEIVYEGRVYPTSEHLFQAIKFMKARPDIAEYIRTSSARPSQAASLGRAYQAFLRPDWAQVQISKMDEILELKFTQHPELMQLLLGTGDVELVHDSSQDSFWGNGADNKGGNELGRALMRLRRKFQRKYRFQQVMTMQQQQSHKRRDSQEL